MGKSVLEELVTILGFEIDGDDAKAYSEQLEKIDHGMKQIIKISAAAAAGLSAFVAANANANDELVKFARTIDATVGEVQRLMHAGKLSGASDSDIMSSLSNLNRMASEAARGVGSGVEIFGLLGISATDAAGRVKPVVQLFEEVSENVRRLGTSAERAEFAQKLGMSDRTVLLLQKGRDEIRALGSELDSVGAILSPEQQKTAEKFMDALVRGRAVIRGWANDLAMTLGPLFTETIDKFFAWSAANRELISSGIVDWADAFARSLKPIAVMLGIIAALIAILNIGTVLFVAAVGIAMALTLDLIESLLGTADDTLNNRLVALLRDFGNWMKDWAKELVDDVVDWFSTIPSRISEFMPDLSFGASGLFDFDMSSLNPFGGFGGLAPAGAASGPVSTTINQSPTVIINGNANREDVRRAVTDALDEKARETEQSLKNPVVG